MKNTIIATTSITTFTTTWWWPKNIFPYSYYGHYAMIMTKICFHFSTTCTTSWSCQKYIYIFISVLGSLFRKHEKIHIFKKTFFLLLLRAHQNFYKIRTCCSNFTVRNFSGVLHALLPKNHASREVLSLKNSQKMLHPNFKVVKKHFQK